MSRTIQDIWQQIERWIGQNAPDISADLQPGATAADIKRAETAVGQRLPKALAESYRIHDGQAGGAPALMGDWRLIRLSQMADEWANLSQLLDDGTFEDTESEPDPGVRAGWWRKSWLPVAANDAGDFICVDVSPAKGGAKGQVITFWHAAPERTLLAESFTGWLAQFADDLEAGRYKVEGGALVRQ